MPHPPLHTSHPPVSELLVSFRSGASLSLGNSMSPSKEFPGLFHWPLLVLKDTNWLVTHNLVPMGRLQDLSHLRVTADSSSKEPNGKTEEQTEISPPPPETRLLKSAQEDWSRHKNVSGIKQCFERLCTVKLAKKRKCAATPSQGNSGSKATVVSFPQSVDDKKDLTCLEKEMGLEPAPSHPTPLGPGSACSARA